MKWKSGLLGGVEESKEEHPLTKLQMDVGEETDDKNATPVATESCRLDTGHDDKVRRKYYCLHRLMKMWDNGLKSWMVFTKYVDLVCISRLHNNVVVNLLPASPNFCNNTRRRYNLFWRDGLPRRGNQIAENTQWVHSFIFWSCAEQNAACERS